MTTNGNIKALGFTKSSNYGSLEFTVTGQDEDDMQANIIELLKEVIDSLGIDAEVFNY